MQEDVNLFEVDPESGSVVYIVNEPEEPEQEDLSESEDLEDAGESVDTSDQFGDLSDTSPDMAEDVEVTQEEASSVDILESVYSGDVMVLSSEAAAAILAASPSGGSLGSSTLDYFDRIVSSLPSDYKYIAYRTSSDNSYDGILYFGDDFDISGNVIMFNEGSSSVEVVRVSSSGYSTVVNYISSSADGASVSFDQSGDVVFYTNAAVGYPVLGGYEQPSGYAPGLTAALIGAAAVVVLAKLMFKR